ncbi:MAG: 4a-hydroxytetrahydrobiopterin dehydratase [Planctomycetes bacterium]|nr:4a-hydroxytetrahydrobiopterin dehydratase [Planctomycetota bacterium]
MAKVPSSKTSAGVPATGAGAAAKAAIAPKLNEAQIEKALTETPEWSHVGDTIQRTYAFGNFVDSMTFVGKVAREAEASQHHPDIMIRYNKVTLTLSTHDSGGITVKDFTLAKKADGLVK